MKKLLLYLLLAFFTINLSSQNNRSWNEKNIYTSISTDIFENLIFENGQGFKATLKKDIFDAFTYSDSRNNQAKYSKEHWANLLNDFQGDKKRCFAWLVRTHIDKENQKNEYSKNIFGDDVYKGNGYFETVKRDIHKNLIFENNKGFKATLKKDIFDAMTYSDNRNNQIKYSKEHWANLLKDFRGDEERCFNWLVDQYINKENQKDDYSKDIFGNDVYKGNGYFETFKRDIHGSLVFENNKGFKATLKKDIFDAMIYSDSKRNQVKYSKEHWPELLRDFRGDEERCLSWLVDQYINRENQKVEISRNIFGDDVYKENGYSETYKRDIHGNLVFENNKRAKATLKKDIFNIWEYSDSNKTKRQFSEKEWAKMLRKHGSEDVIFKQLVRKYLLD